jgi:glycosyltransferase involved in cell wall biosynthesis
MRIAVVAPPWFEVPPPAYGGAEAMCYDLVCGLVGRRHDVTLIAPGTNHTDAAFVRVPRAPVAALGSTESLGFELAHAARAGAIVDELRPDVVHDHSFAGGLAAGGRPFPTIVTVHGRIGPAERDHYAAFPPSVSLVAISRSQRSLNPDLSWLGVVHHGIRVASFPFRRDKDGYALFLGRLNPDKGADLAIDAALEAGLDVVVAAKSTEPLERRFFRDEIEPRLGPGVRWVGEVGAAEKRQLLSRARCLLLPIRWDEPFGLVAIEAMACGTPVVALRRGAVPEIVVDGVTGFVRDDPTALADAVRRTSELDPAACRRHVETSFSAEGMVAAYERAYRSASEPAPDRALSGPDVARRAVGPGIAGRSALRARAPTGVPS